MSELLDLLKLYQKKGTNSTHSIIPDKNTKYSYLQHGWSLDVPPDKLDIFNKQINDLIFNKNIYIWRYDSKMGIKPTYSCLKCTQLLKKYNITKIYTFDKGNVISAISENPEISLAYKIKNKLL